MAFSTAKPIFYGWKMIVVLAITELISYGVLFYSFTIFIKPMQSELGWLSAEITGGYSLSLGITALCAIVVGYRLDRSGPRWIMTAGSCLAALLVLAWANVQTLPAFYAIWFGLGVAKAMVLYDPAFWVVANWFIRRRRQALTLLTFIAGFSTLIFTPLTQVLVEQFGWRNALVILALLLALVTIPLHALVLRRRPADVGLQPDGDTYPDVPVEAGEVEAEVTGLPLRRVIRGSSFWWLTSAFTLNSMMVTVLGIYLVPYLIDTGYEAGFAALAAGLIGLTSLPGRIIFTLSGSRWSPGGIVALLFLMQTVSMVILVTTRSQAAVLAYIILYGAGYGAITPSRAGLVAEFYGRVEYGAISGLMSLCVTIVTAVAPVIAGAVIDQSGSYQAVLWGLITLSGVSVGLVLLAVYTRPRGEVGYVVPAVGD